MKRRALQRAGAIAALLLIGSLFLGPVVASADSFWSGILIDSQRRIAVNCEVGCQQTPATQSNPMYVRLTDKTNNNAQTVDFGYQAGSIDNRNFAATESMIYAMNGNGSVVPVRSAQGTNVLQVTEGGQSAFKLTALTCTQIGNNGTLLSRVWSAGTETATLSIYTDSGCTSLLWSGTPPNTPITFGVDNAGTNFWYKMSATPAVNDYATTN